MKVITQYMGDPYIFFMLTKLCVMWYTSFRLQTQYICKTMPENFEIQFIYYTYRQIIFTMCMVFMYSSSITEGMG